MTKLLIAMTLISNVVYSQEREVDASKPTNLYTQVNIQGEYSSLKSGTNLYGMRGNIQYTFNPDNLLMAEVPLLYNDTTNKFGLSDLRVRFFTVPKRNISKNIIAIAPFIDVTMPTGSFKNGLGGDVWSVGVGSVVGITLSKKVSLFPGISGVWVSEPNDYPGKSHFGVNIQSNASFILGKQTFLFVNPIITILDKTNFSSEFNLNYMIKPNKLKCNIGYFPDFTNEKHTFRGGVTLFL